MGHKYFSLRHFHNAPGYFRKAGRLAHHFVSNARQLRNLEGYSPLGVNKRGIRFYNLLTIVHDNGDFGNAIITGAATGGFNINNGVQSSEIGWKESFLSVKLRRAGKSSKQGGYSQKIIFFTEKLIII